MGQVLSGWLSIVKLQFHLIILVPTNDYCLVPLFHELLQNSGFLFISSFSTY